MNTKNCDNYHLLVNQRGLSPFKLIIFFYSLFTLFVYSFGFTTVLQLWTTLPIFIFSMINPILGISAWVSTIFVETQLLNFTVVLKIILLELGLVYHFLRKKDLKIDNTIFFLVLLLVISSSLSVLFGRDISLNIAVLYLTVIILFLFINIFFTKEMLHILFYSLVINGLMMVIIIILNYIQDPNSVLLYGRISFDGSIRTVANNLILPLYVLLSTMILNNNMVNPIKNNLLRTALLVLFSMIFLLTISRGSIFALILALGIIIILKGKIKMRYLIMIPLLWLSGVAYFLDSNTFRMSRIVEIDWTLNSRTNLYSETFNKFFDLNIFNIMFGTGPGGFDWLLSDTAYFDFYVHSVFLSILIEYGMLGFILITSIILMILISSITKRDYFNIGVSVLMIASFATHGVSATPMFWLILGISCVLLKSHNNKSIIVDQQIPKNVNLINENGILNRIVENNKN